MGSVSAIIRTLIVWLALLAVPFQGFASAAMLPCAPAPAAATHAGNQRMHASPGEPHAAVAAHAGHDGVSSHTHHGSKCGNCGSCCVGGALASTRVAHLAPHEAARYAIPFLGGHMPSVDLDLPERPPRTERA